MKQTHRILSRLDDARVDRRKFLGLAGGAAAASLWIASGCDDSDDPPSEPGGSDVVLDFKDDFGVLNYAYALEQLESAFYAKVVAESLGSAITDPGEKQVFQDLEAHEIIHSEFFKLALGAKAIPALEVDFSSVDFSDRAAVIATAQVFEDLGVAAYNGAGKYLKSADYLTIAGKIVSVEARHAAAIRDLSMPSADYFGASSVIDANGLDRSFEPSKVLEMAGTYVTTSIRLTNVPADV